MAEPGLLVRLNDDLAHLDRDPEAFGQPRHCDNGLWAVRTVHPPNDGHQAIAIGLTVR
jgi:hypothetical protein